MISSSTVFKFCSTTMSLRLIKRMALTQLRFVEERILLLIAQHFQGGFTEDGEIERGFLHHRVGENDLVRQRGFTATRRARDDVERKLWNAAAQDVVEPAHAGRKFDGS